MAGMKTVSVAPTITAGAYSANDVVGGLLTFQVADLAPSGVNPAGGFVRVVALYDDDSEGAAMKLHLFNAAPASIADNAAFAPSFADLQKRIGQVAIGTSDYVTINSNKQATVQDIKLEFATNDGKLYGYLVCDATPTYTAVTDLAIALTVYVV